MMQSLPLVLVPGLTCTARLYGPQVAALWPFGPGDGRRSPARRRHRRDRQANSRQRAAALCARRPVVWAATSPSRCMRQAPERIAKLALLDTSARPDTPEQTAGRKTQIAMAEGGRYGEIRRPVDPALSECEASARRAAHSAGARHGRRKPGRRPSCASSRRSCRGRIRGRCWRRSAARRWCWSATATSRRRRNSTRKSPTAFPARSSRSCRIAGISRRIEQPEAVNAALAEWLAA